VASARLAPASSARGLPVHDIDQIPIADASGRSAPAQLLAAPSGSAPAYHAPRSTGLPDGLRAGIEGLSGLSMDGIRVHYHSPEPARVGALAFTRGADIHVAPSCEQHLPHEAWHAVQQARGDVAPTTMAADMPINDEPHLERDADVMGARAAQTGSVATAPVSPPRPAAPLAGAALPVAQRVIDIGSQRAASDRKAELIKELQLLATSNSVAWLPAFDSMLDADLASDKIRRYPNLVALLSDMVAGSLSAPVTTPKRSLDEARALRQGVKFHRTHEHNPFQPNALATGFHNIAPSRMLKTPTGIRLARQQSQYFYYRERRSDNKADFQVYTTGNPVDPGYIYTDQGEFQGNLDVKDKTGKWSRQSRKQRDRQYMTLGSKYKYPEHTVGHLAPFEHSPFVHDKPIKKGTKDTYLDTDSFEQNLVVENPYVGEQIKRSQVEAKMMANGSYFLQMPVYSSTSPRISTTFNSKEIQVNQKDSSGIAVVDKPHVRPDSLIFGVDQGSGFEWASFDNTGRIRYDTKESKRQTSGYQTRTNLDWKTWRDKRVRKGSDPKAIWAAEKQTTPFPHLAEIYTPPSSTTGYAPWLDGTKTNVAGYQTPPYTPYYLDNATPPVSYEVKGFVMAGEKVTAKTGETGIVVDLLSYDQKVDESTVIIQDEPKLFG
jgi:hypothetical protein